VKNEFGVVVECSIRYTSIKGGFIMESMILEVSEFLATNRKTDHSLSSFFLLFFNSIKKKLKIFGEEDTKLLNEVLITLEEDGVIYFDGTYYQVFDKSKLNKVQGVIRVSKNGAGFVEVIDSKVGLIKYMIHARNLNGALDQDIVILTDFENKHNDTDCSEARWPCRGLQRRKNQSGNPECDDSDRAR